MLPGANNESSLREHDSVALDFVTPAGKDVSIDDHQTESQALHEQKSRGKDKRHCDLPEIAVKCVSFYLNEVMGWKDSRVTVLNACKLLEIHAKVTLV